MRLIDADKLIAQIKSFVERKAITEEDNKIFELICELIDNAPTVTNGTYEQGFRVGAYGRLNEIRPQGEWKEFKYGLYYCSRCFERVDKDIERIESLVSKGERSNYCPACGAKMGGTT